MTRLPKAQTAVRASQSALRSSARSSQAHSPALQQRLLPAASNVTTSAASQHQPQQRRQFNSSPPSRLAEHSGGEHESHFDPPTGWLWGTPPDQKPPKEPWENLWYYGFYGSLIATAIAYAYKPDTSIDTWALEEAKRRLQAEGILSEDE